jgi:hypothetical protein
MTPKERLIKRLNKSLKDDYRWKECPLDYPITSHQTKYASSGGYRWYFKANYELKEKYGDEFVHTISRIGSCYTITELLRYPNDYILFEENRNFELIPRVHTNL